MTGASGVVVAPVAGSSPVARLDAINVALMMTAALLACVVPLELFAFSYIVIGPLHYLTQLAWLRDRRWFTAGRFDPWLLAVPAALLTFGNHLDPNSGDWRAPLALATLFAGAVLVATSQWLPRALLIVATAALAWGVRHDPSVLLLSIMLPSAIHIFVFTGGFILTGALRNRSPIGLASFVVFLATAAVLLFAPIDSGGHAPAPLFVAALAPFTAVRDQLGALLGFAPGQLDGVDRFFGWAYSYHYLNWFSKTRHIGWHRGTRTRLGLIGLGWIACLAFYAIDSTTGFLVVGFIGMLHVVLELPLDMRTFAGLPATIAHAMRATVPR